MSAEQIKKRIIQMLGNADKRELDPIYRVVFHLVEYGKESVGGEVKG